jgi:hypothetical protein
MVDFMSLKIIRSSLSEVLIGGRLCMHMFMEVSPHTCVCIFVCTMFLKNTYRQYKSYSSYLQVVVKTWELGGELPGAIGEQEGAGEHTAVCI